MEAKVLAAAYRGIEGVIVSVEVDMSKGLPSFNIVGLGDTSIRESKERVRSAILNSGFQFPVCRITVNLAPADLKKAGSLFDLPIAIGILMATRQIKRNIGKIIFMGELSLDGHLKPIKGALPIALTAYNNNLSGIILPEENYNECSIINNINLYPFSNLTQVVKFINGEYIPMHTDNLVRNKKHLDDQLDFKDILGLESTKRAIEVAASGNHNLILIGSPGSGKTMMAKRIPSILPPLSYTESIEVTKIYSITGKLSTEEGLITDRPFRNPHHSASAISIIGGGSNLYPGEITLANKGILFLDEMLEFKKNVLQSLREPLEDRKIRISRGSGSIEYPADIMLVGATNPCSCGNYGSNRECICTEYERKKYLNRLSGPLIDRMDIFSFVNSATFNEIRNSNKTESSEIIKKRVIQCRKIQLERYKNDNITCNSQMNEKQIAKYCKLDKDCENLLRKIYDMYKISARAYSKILKISRTIADMNQSKKINVEHITEALNYRQYMDKNLI